MKLKKSLARLIEWERVCRVATTGNARICEHLPKMAKVAKVAETIDARAGG